MKIPGLFFLLLAFSFKGFAQPANDDPCNAIELLASNNCVYQNFTTAAATASVGMPDPGCAGYNGGDVWFKVIVPCTGSLTFDTQTGVIFDGGMAIYSGTCNNLTLIDCDDEGSANGSMPRISATGLASGSTIWVRFWDYDNVNPGTFGICISIPPPSGPGANCANAAPFCTSEVYSFPNNTGILPGLGGGGIYGCLYTTPNPVFYYMQVETAGDLSIHIVQTDANGAQIDVDFACWGPFPDLASSCGGLTANNIVSCSYSSSGDETAELTGTQVGEYYVLLLTNYADDPGTITFQQSGGGAATSCAVICDITASNSGPICPGESFNLTSTLPAGLPGATYSWVGPDCFTSSLQNPTGVTAPLVPGTYIYTVSATTPSGSNCTTQTTVVVGGLSGSSALATNTTCPGLTNGIITATPPAAGGPFTYTLNQGLTTQVIQPGNPVFPNLAPGNYTMTIANSIGCSESHNLVIQQGATLTTGQVTTPTNCPGVNDGTISVTVPATGGPFTYYLNEGQGDEVIQVNNPVFTGLAANAYIVTYYTAAGCAGLVVPNPVVNPGTAPVATYTSNPTSCPGVNNGSITVLPPTGGGPFTYVLNQGLPTQQTQNNNPVFTNLAAGSYTLNFTTSTGCTGVITPAPVVGTGTAPVATSTSTPTTCPGVSNGSITVVPPATGGPFTYILNQGLATEQIQNNNPVFSNLAAGSYTINFTTSIGCAGVISPATVVGTGTGPVATSTSTPTTCPGVSNGSITVVPPATGGPFTYILNQGLSTQQIQNNNPVFTNLAAGSYTINFTTSIGCTGVISPAPVVGTGTGPVATSTSIPTTCPGVNNGSITVVPPSTGGPFTYILNQGLPTQLIQNNNPVFTNLAAGNYTMNFTTSIGCTGVISPAPVVGTGPAPVATYSSTPTSCPGVNDGSITVVPPSTGGPFTYILNQGLPTEQVQNNNPVFLNLAAGSYTINFTTAIGCTGVISPAPVVPAGPSPVATYTSGATTCPGVNDGSITVVPPTVGGPFTYILNQGLATEQIQNNNPVFLNLAAGSYTINFTTAIGCTGVITPAPIVPAGAPLTALAPVLFNPPCSYADDGTITIVPSAAGVYTYILNPGLPGQVTQVNNPLFTGLAAGNYTYNFTNGTGCSGSGTATLTTHLPLAATINKTMPLCNGSANGIIVITATGGLANYQYALSPYTTFQPTGTFNGLAAGPHSFRIRDNAGCILDTTVTLNEPTLLTASAVSAPGTCNGSDGRITITGSNGTPGYSYSLDGSIYQAANYFVVSGATSPGAIYPNIKVKDAKGCVANVSTIYVALIDNMVLIPENDTTICVEQSATLKPDVSTEATIFKWTTIPDASLVATLNSDSIKNPVATPNDTTTYVLNAKWGVCERWDTVTINVLHKPVVFAGKDTAVCYDKTIAVLHGSATNLSGTVNYLWSDSTNAESPELATTVVTPPVTETFLLTVTDNYGCNFTVTDAIVVTVQPPVPAFAGKDTIAVTGQPHQLLASGGVQYLWSPASPLNLATLANPLATLTNDQLFTVTVTDIAGCVGYDTIFVKAYPGPTYNIPNAFSPNGDGLNDIFRVIPAGISYTQYFRIFNRFGEMVFETNQWLKGWDGTYLGKKQAIGNYVWIVKGMDRNGRVVEMKGTVLLVQ